MKYLKTFESYDDNLTVDIIKSIRTACDELIKIYDKEDKKFDYEFTYDVLRTIHKFVPNYNYEVLEDHIQQQLEDGFEVTDVCDIAIDFMKENPIYFSKKLKNLNDVSGILENASSYNEIDFEKMHKEHRKLLDKFMRKMEKNPEQITSFDYVDILCELFKKHVGDDKDWDKFYNVVMEYGDELVNGGGDLFDDMFNFMVDYLEQNPLFFSKKLDDMNDKTGVFETFNMPAHVSNDKYLEKELWEKLLKEYRETVFLPSKIDDVEYCLSYDKAETQEDSIKRNLYIRSKAIDFFKQKGFTSDWAHINRTLSWKNIDYDIETNFEVMFDYIVDFFSRNHPTQIFMTQKLRNFNNDTGVFESLSSKLEEIKAYLERNKDDLSTFFSDMFPGKVISQKKLNELGFYMLEEKEYACEETTLPYNKIYFTQKFLHENGLNPDKTGRPKVYYFNDRFILEDGHHRFVNQLLNGNTNIEVLLCKLIG